MNRKYTILFQVLVLICVLLSQKIHAQTNSGTYTTYIGGQKFAVENYEIKKLSADSARFVSKVAAQTDNVFTLDVSDNKPSEFMIETNGTKVLSAVFSPNEAKVSITGQAEKTVEAKVDVVLENIVWIHYKTLLAKYDTKKGGAQKFTAFLPSQAVAFETSLEKIGAVSRKIGGKMIELNEFRLVNAKSNLLVNILADKNGEPIFFDIPSQQVIAVKSGFEDLRESSVAAKVQLKEFSGEFSEEEVSFKNGDVKLAGTLTIPKNNRAKHPAVVIISGSGLQDRDGKSVANLYKIIAENLSQAGIAVLRADDRGVGKSSMPAGTNISYRDLINDSIAAVDYLMTRNEINKTKIALLGHSEGAETALTIASENPKVAAVILLAGSSFPLDKIVVEQELYQRAQQETVNVADETKIMPLAKNLMKQLETAAKPENKSNLKFAWFREHLVSNPSLLAQKVKQPALILQGERDSLVLAYHAIELSKAFVKGGNKNVSLRILPDLTHLFTSIGEKNTAISDEFLKTLQNWADANLK